MTRPTAFPMSVAVAGMLAMAVGCSDIASPASEETVEEGPLAASPDPQLGATVSGTEWFEFPVNMEVSAEENACLDVATLVTGVGRMRVQTVEGPNGKTHVNFTRDVSGVHIESLEPGDDRTWVFRPDIFNRIIHTDPARPGFGICDGCQLFHSTHRALARAVDEGRDYHIRNVAQLVVRPDGTIANFFMRREFLECFPSGGGGQP